MLLIVAVLRALVLRKGLVGVVVMSTVVVLAMVVVMMMLATAIMIMGLSRRRRHGLGRRRPGTRPRAVRRVPVGFCWAPGTSASC